MPTLTSQRALERDATDLHEALSDLIRVYQFRDRDRICCFDLSVTQCYALETLVRHGPLTVNELAARLYLDKSTASRVVDALERKSMLRKLVHPEDRRAVHLTPTPEGEARYQQIASQIRKSEMRMLEDFDPEVRRGMIDLVRRLGRAAASRVDASGGTCCCID
jgi:MarR family transcriptional regulator, 2-MHQ and catechol-resistance regulon repressor